MSFLERDKYGMYKNTGKGKKGPGPALMGADTLLGENVVNRADEHLGEIKEIMIDMGNGEIAYAVMSFGGVLGMGEKLFAVPWQALNLDTANKRFVLDVDKKRLKSAPGFDRDAWPDIGDVAYTEEIHAFYGTNPSNRGRMGQNMPMDGMVGGAMRGAGASSMGAGQAGSGAGISGGTETGGSSGAGGRSGSGLGSGAGSSGSAGASGGAGVSRGAGTSGSSGADSGPGTTGSSGVSGQPTRGGGSGRT